MLSGRSMSGGGWWMPMGSIVKMSGYGKTELLQLHISELDANEAPEGTATRIRRNMETGFERFEAVHCAPEEIVSGCFILPIRSPACLPRSLKKGMADRIAAEVARRQAVHSSRRNEEEQRLLLDNLRAGAVMHAPDQRVLSCNQAACDILGLSHEQLMGELTPDSGWRLLDATGGPLPIAAYPVQLVLSSQEKLEHLCGRH